ncbi:MAG: pilus assembly protein TadG-related protein [Pseudomonadota bacterium]
MPFFLVSLVAIMALIGGTLALSMDSRAANNLQHTTDAAALAGATAFLNSTSPKLNKRIETAETASKVYAAETTDYALRAFNVVSASEDAYGQSIKLAVELGFSPVNAAANLSGRNANVDINQRAVAEAVWGFPLCTLSLSQNETALSLSGAASLEAKNCILWSNSAASDSLRFTGGHLSTKSLCTHGLYKRSGDARVRPTPETKCDRLPDPLAYWKAPLPGSIQVHRKLSDPVPPRPDRPRSPGESLTGTDVSTDASDSKFKSNPKLYLKQIDKLLKDDYDRDDFPKMAHELIQIGSNGLDPYKDTDRAVIALDGRGNALDSDYLDDVTGPAQGNDWSHPGLNIGQGGQTDLKRDGTLRRGPGKTLSLWELAQGAGLAPRDGETGTASEGEPPISEDKFANQPTLTLQPGTYGGLHIHRGHVLFLPGVYHIVDAPFVLRRRATFTARDVTFVLHGDKATFEVWDEARLTLTAPVSGPTAGFAIAQNRDKVSQTPFATSVLAGSGKANLVGTVYLPKQNLQISGKGSGAQSSPLLQIVANEIHLKDEGRLAIDFNEQNTNVPAVIKPERSARLVE